MVSRILSFVGNRPGIFWVFGVAAVCHLAFSRLGFVPTDEGYYLAASRRMFVEGQFPYSDFFWNQPPLTPVIQAPALLFGDYAFYFSRFVFWLQCAATAWFSVSAFARGNFSNARLPVQFVCLVAPVAFFLNVNNFPTMMWETVDALLFVSLGLYMLGRSENSPPGGNFAAYAVMGLSYLCKHTFVIAVFSFPFLLGGWRNPLSWLGAAAPGFVFLGFLTLSGTLPDAYSQLGYLGGAVEVKIGELSVTSATNFLEGGAFRQSLRFFGQFGFFLAGLVSGTVIYFFRERKLIQAIFVSCVCFAAFWHREGFVGPNFLWHFSFVLLGACLAVSMVLAAAGDFRRSGFFAAVTVAAFVAGISNGWGGPQRFSGTLAAAVLVLVFLKAGPRFFRALMIPAVFLLSLAFADLRTNELQWEPKDGAKLQFPLDGALAGARLIKTNQNFRAVMVELNAIVAQVRDAGRSYAMVPYVPAWWAMSGQANPLPSDWPDITEIGISQRLTDRYLAGLKDLRGRFVVVVHKFCAATYAYGFVPDRLVFERKGHAEYAVSQFVRRNFTKIGETRFFELYE